MKIAITTERGTGIDDVVASRAGRAPYITFIEVDQGSWEVLSVKVIRNPGAMSGGGAGVKMAQAVSDADVIVGPAFGPNAAAILTELGVKMVTLPPGTPVRRALEEVRKQL